MDEVSAAVAVREWGNLRVDDRNRWNRSSLGRAIKEVVEGFGNWKNAPRGAPAKAGRASIAKKREEVAEI